AEATFVSAIDIQELIAEGTGDEPDVLGEKLDELVFENFYVMTHDNLDPEIETEGLNVSKVTTGMLAEYDLYFEYAVWIKAPDAVNEAALRASDGVDGFAGYYAYVLDTKDGETTTTVDNGPTFVTTPGDYEGALFFSNETTTTVFLKHSQTLVFVGTHVGTQWAVTEVDPFDYIPEYVLTRGGVAGSVVQGEQGEALATGKQQLIQGVNAADYVNFLPHTPRTGLLIGMLHPLMLTAIVLLIVLMLVESYKNRRAKELVPVSVY
ncbi:MAG: hypothetical protein FWE46_04740, partial [Coriobacteriia bacterium]|nr:hypothetical protein [Coriobacteriia bacterium]